MTDNLTLVEVSSCQLSRHFAGRCREEIKRFVFRAGPNFLGRSLLIPGYGCSMQSVSVVVPCFRGETTLAELMEEIRPLHDGLVSPGQRPWRVEEVILVFDGSSRDLALVLERLQVSHDFVSVVWLSRNFGQHAATIAGLSRSKSRWVVTLDEDGQHNPADIGGLLDQALEKGTNLVYATPTNEPHHGAFRNGASRLAKRIAAFLIGTKRALNYQSFRLIDGELARLFAFSVGPRTYLDVALEWFTSEPALAPVTLRDASQRKSGYSLVRLVSHFWRLFLSIGPRSMRLVSGLGLTSALAGVGLAVYFAAQRAGGAEYPEGWASQITVSLVSAGAVLFCLGLISEYLGTIVSVAQGRPVFVIQEKSPGENRN